MALDTDDFGNKKLHFPLPWVVLIRTIKWAAMAINMYVGFLDGELLSISKKNLEYFSNDDCFIEMG